MYTINDSVLDFRQLLQNSWPIIKRLAFAEGLFQTSNRNVEPVAEQVAGFEYHQLHHFLAHSAWENEPLIKDIGLTASRLLNKSGKVGLIFDPTGIAKKGVMSVGVGRQYLGSVGKVDNGPVFLTAALVEGRSTCLIDEDQYVPKSWAESPDRCDKAKIPNDVRAYRNHREMVLQMLNRIDARGISYDWIGMDAEFGSPLLFNQLSHRGKTFMVDVRSMLQVYPRHPKLRTTPKGFKGKAGNLRYQTRPIPVKDLIVSGRWQQVVVREATKGPLKLDIQQRIIWIQEKKKGKVRSYQLVIRRDRGESKTRLKFSITNASSQEGILKLAFLQCQKFWIEQAIKESKQWAGKKDYQVRHWQPLHHHMAMVMLVGLFMMIVRIELVMVKVNQNGSASMCISPSPDGNLSSGPTQKQPGIKPVLVEREIPLRIGDLIYDTFFTVIESVDALNDDFHLNDNSLYWIYLNKRGETHCIRLSQAPKENEPLWDFLQVIFKNAQAEENLDLDQVNMLCTMIYKRYSH